MKKIKLTINDQNVQAAKVITVNGTTKLIECEFMFNDHWDAFPAKKAIFKNNNMADSYETVIVNNKCVVPHEALKKDGIVRVAIKGSNTDNQTERTETVDVICQNKTLQGGINAIDPTPDQYAQYVEHVGEVVEEYFDEHPDTFKGDNGDDGFSPIATVTPTSDGAKISITDKEGTTEATVHNGVGEKGDDGISPVAVVTQTPTGAILTVTDAAGTTTATISNGAKGDKGDDYVITDADKHEIADEVEGKYTTELTGVKESLNQKVGFTDYATSSKGGVAKVNPAFGVTMNGQGEVIGWSKTKAEYEAINERLIISKGTLENVLAERLDSKSIKTLTQEEYNLIENPSANTIYIII